MFSCEICRNNRCVVIANKDQMRFACFGHYKWVVRCSNCGLVQLFPQWTENKLANLYQAYSAKKDFVGQKKTKHIDYYLEEHFEKGTKILEIGTGRGDNLFYFKDKGYDILGIDVDPTVCDGKHILNRQLHDVSGKFDFIYAIHLFEHIKRPDEFIKDMRQALKKGGRFLLEVPSIRDPLIYLYKNKAYGKFYYYPFHLFFYEQETIKKLFARCGIDVKVILKQRYGIINHLRWLFLGKPGNWNPKIPILDDIYSKCLKRLGISDTIIVLGQV